MIRINDRIALREDEIRLEFVRASGPGGQKVNKASTAVQLRFDLRNSPSLPEDVRARLLRLARNRVSGEGILIVDARRFRSQERNRQDAMERLIALVRAAARKPRPRRKTRPTEASQGRRLESKRRHAQKKRTRSRSGCEEA